MKWLFLILLGLFAAFMLLREQPKPQIVYVTPAPASPTKPQIVYVTPARSSPANRRVSKAPAPPQALATILNPTFVEIFGHDDADAERIIRAAKDVETLPIKLRVAVDAADANKLNSALRLCGLMQQAIQLTRAASEQDRRNRSVEGAKQISEKRERMDDFFAESRVREWNLKMDPLRLQAAREMAALGPVGPLSPQEKRNADYREKVKSAVSITIEVYQVLPGGVLADKYDSYAIGDSSSRVGLGGNVAVGERASGRLIYVQGVSGKAEGDRATLTAFRDGNYNYNDGIVAHVYPKWICADKASR